VEAKNETGGGGGDDVSAGQRAVELVELVENGSRGQKAKADLDKKPRGSRKK
jgi:formiminotetrahydrofolate cyclodeaminase